MHTVGYLYDPIFHAHKHPNHPENSDRLESIMGLLIERGVLGDLLPLPFMAATPEQLCSVHRASYISALKQLSLQGGGMLEPSTYVNEASYDAAAMAAGAGIAAVAAVLSDKVERAFAFVRPPGHHAFADHGEGFCLFNNVAFAARCALDEFGLRRVMIVDWDVHHGNGTQDIFYEDPHVLYVSTHQMPLYPGTGRVGDIGEGAGEGMTVNIPLQPGIGDAGFASVFDEIVCPIARRYEPELILISAGYDAHWRDSLAGWRYTLGGLNVSLGGFARMAETLVALSEELCQGRVVGLLEGGYDLEVLSNGVLNTLYVLMGQTDNVSDPLGPYTGREPSVDHIVNRVKQVHRL
ncbi:MAG: histone deacetylase [Chloroflexi bacterium]|nr:histone deacetylase [Chloroflexota bacterium]